jgi:hypothetical protein
LSAAHTQQAKFADLRWNITTLCDQVQYLDGNCQLETVGTFILNQSSASFGVFLAPHALHHGDDFAGVGVNDSYQFFDGEIAVALQLRRNLFCLEAGNAPNLSLSGESVGHLNPEGVAGSGRNPCVADTMATSTNPDRFVAVRRFDHPSP